VQESATAATGREEQRVRSLLDEAARCRSADPLQSRQFALDARVLARTCSQPMLEAEALYHLASIAHQRGRSEYAFALAT
jgi:hypothetical protein